MLSTLFVVAGALCPSVPTSPAVDEEPFLDLGVLVRGCDQVVRAEIVALTFVECSRRSLDEICAPYIVRLIELRLDDVVWGTPETRTMTIVDPRRTREPDLHGALSIGDRAYWFLDRWNGCRELDDATHARIESMARGASLQGLARYGLARMPIEGDGDDATVCLDEARFRCWDCLPSVGRHTTTTPVGTWLRVRRSNFERCLRAELSAIVPSVDVEYCSTGPIPRWVKIEPSGRLRAMSWESEDEQQKDFGRNELVALVDLAVERGFFDWPLAFGHSRSSCPAYVRLRIRTGRGSRVIHVWGPSGPHDTPLEREAHAGATAILKAIPFARRWKIDGH